MPAESQFCIISVPTWCAEATLLNAGCCPHRIKACTAGMCCLFNIWSGGGGTDTCAFFADRCLMMAVDARKGLCSKRGCDRREEGRTWGRHVFPLHGWHRTKQKKKPTGGWKLNPADAFSLIKLIDSLVSGTPCLVSIHYHMEYHQKKKFGEWKISTHQRWTPSCQENQVTPGLDKEGWEYLGGMNVSFHRDGTSCLPAIFWATHWFIHWWVD